MQQSKLTYDVCNGIFYTKEYFPETWRYIVLYHKLYVKRKFFFLHTRNVRYNKFKGNRNQSFSPEVHQPRNHTSKTLSISGSVNTGANRPLVEE